MNTAPTRIWAVDGETPYYYEEGEERPAEVTEYVRIDLHQARIAELEAERDAAWNAALEAAVEAVQENIFRSSSPDLALNLAIYGRDAVSALMKKEGGDE